MPPDRVTKLFFFIDMRVYIWGVHSRWQFGCWRSAELLCWLTYEKLFCCSDKSFPQQQETERPFQIHYLKWRTGDDDCSDSLYVLQPTWHHWCLCRGDRQGESYQVQRAFVMNCNEQCCPFAIEINEDLMCETAWFSKSINSYVTI